VIESRQGNLLGAKIADDGQWRFPVIDSVPKKFEICLLQFEDAYFYKHFGFNPVSMAKAVRENIVASKTVRGGSALTKQVIRLSINKRTLIFRNNTYATIGYFLHILAYQNLQLCRT
jgi:penicillin-binding protein 1C